MLTFVPFGEITDKHLTLIAESLNAGCEFWRLEAEQLLRKLFNNEAHLFSFADEGIMVLSAQRNETLGTQRLLIDAWSGDGSIFSRKPLADDLRRIAADWECDTIETIVFDLRLADAICRIGGSVESICVTLPVERSN